MPAPVLEKEIEKAVTDYAKQTGWSGYKWVSPGYAGVPDRIYFIHGHCLCIEFKALGKRATKLQHINILHRHKIEAHVIDNVTEGKYVLDEAREKWAVSDSDTVPRGTKKVP